MTPKLKPQVAYHVTSQTSVQPSWWLQTDRESNLEHYEQQKTYKLAYHVAVQAHAQPLWWPLTDRESNHGRHEQQTTSKHG